MKSLAMFAFGLLILGHTAHAQFADVSIECKNSYGSFSYSCASFSANPTFKLIRNGLEEIDSSKLDLSRINSRACSGSAQNSRLVNGYYQGNGMDVQVGTAYVDGYILSLSPGQNPDLSTNYLNSKSGKNITATGVQRDGEKLSIITLSFNEDSECVFKPEFFPQQLRK